MGRELEFFEVAYLAFDDLKLYYSERAPIQNNNTKDDSRTSTLIIVLSCMFAVFVLVMGVLFVARHKRVPKYKSFNDNYREGLEIQLKDFSVDF